VAGTARHLDNPRAASRFPSRRLMKEAPRVRRGASEFHAGSEGSERFPQLARKSRNHMPHERVMALGGLPIAAGLLALRRCNETR
jgi:hypothetical protein